MEEDEGREDGSTVDEDVDDPAGIEDDGSTIDEEGDEESSCAIPRQAIASKAAKRITDVRILVQTKKKNNQSHKEKKNTRRRNDFEGGGF